MQKVKIVLVEDDELASELIYDFLSGSGFEVIPLFTATDTIAYVRNNKVDLIILDIQLPDFDGYEVLKNIRTFSPVPIIVTSAYSDTQAKLLAFKYGALDYMVKPIDLEELEARIWVQLTKYTKISTQNQKDIYTYNKRIYFKDEVLQLTNIEYTLLSIFLQRPNQIIPREELLATLSSISSNRSLDNHIKNIRKKIGDSGKNPKYLKTEYGVGYSLRL
jgi:DNA-binding response OmpR family regulator